jgi:hypothetical protein
VSDNKNVQPATGLPTPTPQEKSPDFRVIYSNSFQYRITLTDLSLVFSTMADTGEAGNSLVTTQQAVVIMALGQVKSLAEYLNMIIARYEREIGPIGGVGRAPPNEAEIDGMFGILKGIGTH